MFQSDAYDFRKGGKVRGKAEFKKEVTMSNVKLTGELENNELRVSLDDKINLYGDV